jgi:hypothetical protein
MTSIYTQQFTVGPLTLAAQGESLIIDACGKRMAHICGLPPHVAAHTAAAFNRAMQAVPDKSGGWTYTTKSGVWHIVNEGKPFGFRAQHDDITGDNDPAWMFTEASTLIDCMDAIDVIESENTCTECHALVGDDATDMQDGRRWLCPDCLTAEQEHERGLAEMADDDRAHAAMERVAGL